MTTAYTASNSLPMSGLPAVSGIVQKFVASATNTGDATYAPDGLAAAPIFGLGAQPLQGGEIVASGTVTLESYIGPLLNSGAVCWVLLECEGGAQQVANATASLHALNRSSADARYAALAGLATQVFAVANATSANQAVNLGQFPASLVGNGNVGFPNGLKLKWGSTNPIANGSYQNVVFDTPFPNGVLAIFGSQISDLALNTSNVGNFATGNMTASGMTIWSHTGDGAGGGTSTWYWLAIGY